MVLDIPNRTIVIKTAEDAQQQFLRGKITEEQMREVFAAHGVTRIQAVPSGIEPIDNAFERKIPQDLIDGPAQFSSVEDRAKHAEQKAAQREAATKAATKVEADAKPETDLAVLQNQKAVEAAEKLEKKQDDPLAKTPEERAKEADKR